MLISNYFLLLYVSVINFILLQILKTSYNIKQCLMKAWIHFVFIDSFCFFNTVKMYSNVLLSSEVKNITYIKL